MSRADATIELPEATLAVLAARNLAKSFAGVAVLQDVSLTLRPGQVLALMGVNGAGKSTLMSILCGAIRPDIAMLISTGDGTGLTLEYAKALGFSAILHKPVEFPDLLRAVQSALVKVSASSDARPVSVLPAPTAVAPGASDRQDVSPSQLTQIDSRF